jgi:hypothetical protein
MVAAEEDEVVVSTVRRNTSRVEGPGTATTLLQVATLLPS